jgi:membrane-bound serine protease (ClpP class)
MKHLIFIALAVVLVSVPLFGRDRYAVIKLEGSVNPIMAQYISESMKDAQKKGMKFIVIQLDTPGGLVISMQEIIKAIMTSDIPVVVYTYPKGAHAASAGGYIMLAAHIAVMAPATNIGAMHPVSLFDISGDDKKKDSGGVMGLKALNDLLAYARSLAQERKRNVAWTERAVRNAVSSTHLEALKENVIDFVAEDMDDLLHKLNNRKVRINERVHVLKTGDCEAVYFFMDWKQKFLNFFADPTMVLLLLVVAVIGIGLEVKSPGLVLPGTLGGVSLFLFLMAVRVLPVNIAGLLLILLSIALFILELKFTSYGLLTIGGIASFVFGSMILFDSPLPGGSVPVTTIMAAVTALLVFMFVVVRAVLLVHKGQVTTGREGIIGEEGEVLLDFNEEGKGKVMVHGEIWDAKSADRLKRGDGAVVVEVIGMILSVRKK